MAQRRVLIDDWFPIQQVSIESIRERSASSALPPLYFLHVWFARRPLTASRAAVLLSLLPEDADRSQVLKLLGMPTDTRDMVERAERLERAKASGKREKENPLNWPRAYTQTPTRGEIEALQEILVKEWGKAPLVLDSMAGGGSIPFEAIRLGLPTVAGDLNPVSYLVLKATLEYPAKYGKRLLKEVDDFASKVHERAKGQLEPFFPKVAGEAVQAYLWSRTIKCGNCGLVIPMSPNWWIIRGGDGEKEYAVRLQVPELGEGDVCDFEVVRNPRKAGIDPDKGTDMRKEAVCPRCGRITGGDEVKSEAQAGRMEHQLYAVCTKMKRGGRRSEWVFREPRSEEYEAARKAEEALKQKLPEWEKQGLVPTEAFPEIASDTRPLQYGMNRWCDLFNPRQLLTHLTYLEAIKQEKEQLTRSMDKELVEAVSLYTALIFDTCVNYSTLLSRWDSTRGFIRGSLDMQAFPFKSSYAEWNQIVEGAGYEWAVRKTLDALKEIIKLLPENPGMVQVYCGDSASIPFDEGSVDCIVVDPPYHANVMYAEVSDFFYVWLKRLVGDIYPEVFRLELTEKQEEAVANSALFRDAGGRSSASSLAARHYESKMEACFRDMHRVLRDDGSMTVMFTHKESEAWASLATALINAGFTFTASWPVLTEPGQKFGKADKGVLKATVLLACRKRVDEKRGLWERVIQELYDEAERKVREHSEQGITGPDLLVSVYGPVLGRFADYSSVRDASGKTKNTADALTIVADVVNKHLTADLPSADLDTLSYLNMVREFPGLTAEYDLARLTTVFGGNMTLDSLDLKGGRGLVSKKAGKVQILTSRERVEAGAINPNKPETIRSLIDAVHASIQVYEARGVPAVAQLLRETGHDIADTGYLAALRAVYYAGSDPSADRKLAHEARIIGSLLEALGHRPDTTRKPGERLDDYVE